MEENKNTRRKLVSGKCDYCTEEAQIPWKENNLCYFHWILILSEVIKEIKNDKKKKRD